MDPTTVFCPNLACPARGQFGQGNIGIHSRKDQRFLCTQCRKTFAATKGTAFYRLRTPAETVALVLTLLAHGCPLQAIVVAFGFCEQAGGKYYNSIGLIDADGSWLGSRHKNPLSPHPHETSIPGLFAVGDVRSGSVKRVASAVGEGSVVVSEIHQFLATPQV